MELSSIVEEIPGIVYKITGTIGGQEKIAYYVQHSLGTESPGYTWLLDRYFRFQTLFLKAFSICVNEQVLTHSAFTQIRNLISANESMVVVTERSSQYKHNDSLPHLLDPSKISLMSITETPYHFGYERKLVVADARVMYATYPEHIAQAQVDEHRKREEQRRMEQERREAAQRAIDDFLRLPAEDKMTTLIETGYISQDGDILSVNLDSRKKDLCNKMTASTIREILLVAGKRGTKALKLILSAFFEEMHYQKLPTDIARALFT